MIPEPSTTTTNHEPTTDKIILNNGEQLELAFPSLSRIKKLSTLLGVDLFADGLKDIKYSAILLDEHKPVEIMNVCLGKQSTEDILEKITPSDFDLIVTAFFFKAKTASVNLTGDLNVLRSFTDSDLLLNRLKDTLLTSQSSPQQVESRTESIT